ncbi:MAG: MFS transporter [Gemmatimonadaceae bacterium]|nr:MFS transporter [Gemmatimonadaceae bacterium]
MTAGRLPRTVKALALVSLFTDASSEIIYPLLPLFLTSVLHAGASAIGIIEGAAETTASLLKLASGWWSDRVRRRKPLVVAGYTLASVVRPLVALANGAGQVLAIRLTDRVGKGIRTSPRDALIADAVPLAQRGRAFGLHRAGDHMGAVIGPLIAFSVLRWTTLSLRALFLLAAIPGALAVIALVVGVKETPRPARSEASSTAKPTLGGGLPGRFWAYLLVLLVFTLGNSSDAFLLLRASQLGVASSLIPILWAMLHVVKAGTSTPAGTLSDRVGRVPLIVGGWIVYALVYLAFGRAGATWQAWALFAVYGTYFGLTEGVEKALVADLVPAEKRGAGFGWYNLAIGLGALPASVVFGIVWDRYGAARAFELGASLSAMAAVGLVLVMRGRRAPA